MYPILFSYGDLVIRTYTIAGILAMLVAMHVVRLEVRRLRWPVTRPIFFVAKCTLMGWIGAHIMYTITRFELPWGEWLRMMFLGWGHGNVWFGGFLLVWLYVYLSAKKFRIPIYQMYDVAIFAALVAISVGRIGCLFGGCCYGSPTDLPWGISLAHVTREGYDGPLHPVQLYEFFYQMSVFTVLWRKRTKIKYQGQLAVQYLIYTSIGRFVLEFFRGDTIRGFVGNTLSTSQFLAIFLVGAAFVLKYYALKSAQKHS